MRNGYIAILTALTFGGCSQEPGNGSPINYGYVNFLPEDGSSAWSGNLTLAVIAGGVIPEATVLQALSQTVRVQKADGTPVTVAVSTQPSQNNTAAKVLVSLPKGPPDPSWMFFYLPSIPQGYVTGGTVKVANVGEGVRFTQVSDPQLVRISFCPKGGSTNTNLVFSEVVRLSGTMPLSAAVMINRSNSVPSSCHAVNNLPAPELDYLCDGAVSGSDSVGVTIGQGIVSGGGKPLARGQMISMTTILSSLPSAGGCFTQTMPVPYPTN